MKTEDTMALLDQSKSTTDIDPLLQFAPEASTVIARLMANLWGVTDPELLELVRARISQLLRNESVLTAERIAPAKLAALPQWPTSPLFSPTERTVLGFTEQFIMDVAGVSAEQSSSLGEHLDPAELGGFVTALYLLDYGLRTQMALDRLFPGSRSLALAPGDAAGAAAPPARGLSLQGDVDALLMAIARLDSLDMVTTEVVRLRGARRHNCRICQSTRSVKALDAGADEAMFDKIDHYESSDLVESHKVALRLADAIITQPTEIDPSLVAQVHQYFTPSQVTEIVLDVMRNSCQKVAVALAVDDPHVASGVELYALTPDGDVEFLGAPTH
jgi:alkylhydroperoxidase family enzyme